MRNAMTDVATAPQVPRRAAATTTAMRYSGDASATPTACSSSAIAAVAATSVSPTRATRTGIGRATTEAIAPGRAACTGVVSCAAISFTGYSGPTAVTAVAV